MRTLEEQISNKCIHFNGMMNKKCDKGIEYDSVRVKTEKPYKVPCLLHTGFSGGECVHSKFPTKEEVAIQVDEIQNRSKKMTASYLLVKDQYKKTNEATGKVECPVCKGELSYSVAELNGHIWAKCSGCEMGWME